MLRPTSSSVATFALLLAACSGGTAASNAPAADAGSTFDATAAVADDAGSEHADSAPQATDGGSVDDAGDDAIDDAGADGPCEWGGAPGACMTLGACAALSDHTSYAGQCPGPASIECCIVTPSTADNPPTPIGYQLMAQADVTTAMTTWAVAILDAPTTYPMFSTTTKVFGTLTVLARVEWHPPDFQNSVIHRGVTLYEPAD